MSRWRRNPGMDLTYSDEHRKALPELYGERIGHRLNVADRDWTEFCHWCREPIGIYEEVRDVGQDINDKATTLTRKLAHRASLPAFLFGWHCERPESVQRQINGLNSEVRRLEAEYPITGFKAKQIYPKPTPLLNLAPSEWWREGILILHFDHYRKCPRADEMTSEFSERIQDARNGSRLWTPADQLELGLAA